MFRDLPCRLLNNSTIQRPVPVLHRCLRSQLQRRIPNAHSDSITPWRAIVAALASSAWVAVSEPPQPWYLEAGFEGDPRSVEIAAAVRTWTVAVFSGRTQLVVDYVSGEFALSIGTASLDADTTIEVTMPRATSCATTTVVATATRW